VKGLKFCEAQDESDVDREKRVIDREGALAWRAASVCVESVSKIRPVTQQRIDEKGPISKGRLTC
jgi:hypothetical protein